MLRTLIPITIVLILSLAACAGDDGAETTEPVDSSGDASSSLDDTSGDPADAVTSLDCDPGATQACVCQDGDGTQVCSADGSAWEPCECAGSSSDIVTTPDTSAEADASGPSQDCNYTGGWPCNPDKDAMPDPGWAGSCPGGTGCDCLGDQGCLSNHCVVDASDVGRCAPPVGELAPRLTSVDQFGDLVDLYDFAGHDTPVVITLSAGWTVAGLFENWLKGDDESGYIPDTWDPVRSAVLSGELTWITLLLEDQYQMPATPEYQAAWSENFGFSKVPLLLDTDYKFTNYYSQYGVLGIPALLVFDGDLKLLVNGVTDPDSVGEVLTGLFE